MKVQQIILIAMLPAVLVACGKSDAKNTVAVPSNAPDAMNKSVQVTAEKISGPRISRDPALNAAPLGVEVGYANREGVKEKLGGLTKFMEQGTSEYSGGLVLSSSGDGLGIDGLSKLMLLFDKSDVLVGVIMTLPKDPRDVYGKLSGKYTTVENHIDEFMNKGSARLEKGDSWVEIEAPHLSFTMDVLYMTKKLKSDFERQSAEAETRKQQGMADKL